MRGDMALEPQETSLTRKTERRADGRSTCGRHSVLSMNSCWTPGRRFHLLGHSPAANNGYNWTSVKYQVLKSSQGSLGNIPRGSPNTFGATFNFCSPCRLETIKLMEGERENTRGGFHHQCLFTV